MMNNDNNQVELQEGTALAICSYCTTEFVVMKEFLNETHYCSDMCSERHSLFYTEDTQETIQSQSK